MRSIFFVLMLVLWACTNTARAESTWISYELKAGDSYWKVCHARPDGSSCYTAAIKRAAEDHQITFPEMEEKARTLRVGQTIMLPALPQIAKAKPVAVSVAIEIPAAEPAPPVQAEEFRNGNTVSTVPVAKTEPGMIDIPAPVAVPFVTNETFGHALIGSPVAATQQPVRPLPAEPPSVATSNSSPQTVNASSLVSSAPLEITSLGTSLSQFLKLSVPQKWWGLAIGALMLCALIAGPIIWYLLKLKFKISSLREERDRQSNRADFHESESANRRGSPLFAQFHAVFPPDKLGEHVQVFVRGKEFWLRVLGRHIVFSLESPFEGADPVPVWDRASFEAHIAECESLGLPLKDSAPVIELRRPLVAAA